MTRPLSRGGDWVESLELDREIRAERSRAKQWQSVDNLTTRRDKTQPNKELTVEELQRRAVARAHIAGKKPIGRWPKPRQQPNGRWQAKVICNGVEHCRTFDTKEAAEEWIIQVKENES